MPAINPWHILYSIRAVNAWQKMINSNIVGATRVGYKAADVFFGGNATQVAYGQGGSLRQVGEQSLSLGYTSINFSQGAITHSSDWAHVAINGPGFFYTTNDLVAPKKEDLNYTRDGQFYVDADGILRTKEGLYVLDGTQIPGVNDPTSEWYPPWNGSIFYNWIERNKLRVRNNTNKDLTKETVVELTVDTQKLVNEGKVQNDLQDIRIGYYDYFTSTWINVPMEIVPDSLGNIVPSTNTKIRFRLQKDLAQGESVTDEYFMFSKYLDTPVTGTVQAITQITSPPIMVAGKNIGTTDPTGIIDKFNGTFNPISDGGSTATGPFAPEDWIKAVGQTGNLWRVGLPDSTSDSWAGLAAGNIGYVQGTGYQFNTGSQEIFRVKDTSRPNGWKFVDENGNEIMMKVIDGTNNNGNSNPNYDFTISDNHNSGSVNGSGNYFKYPLNNSNPTNRQWEEFRPTDLKASWPKPDLTSLSIPYNTTINAWGQTPYSDSTYNLTTGDVPGSAWQGNGTNNNYEYLLLRQPIYVGAEGLIRNGGSLNLDGFVNKDVTIILRKPDGSFDTLYTPTSPGNGVTSFTGTLNYSQLVPGTNWIEVYATKDIATTSPLLIPLDTTSWTNGPTAGSITYKNGEGYSFGGEQLYLKKTYNSGTGEWDFEVVDGNGNKPQMQVLTEVKQENIKLKGIPQNPGSGDIPTGGILTGTTSSQTTGWKNVTGTSVSRADDNTNGVHPNPEAYSGQGYWHDLDDSYRLGGEVHFTNTINFIQNLLENDSTGDPTSEKVNISGSVFAQDGWNLSVMSGGSFSPPSSKAPYGTGNWEMDGYALGIPDSFPDTPESNDLTRVYTVGDTAKLSAVGVNTKVAATNQSLTAFNESINSSQFSETSTFLLSGLTGKVGKIVPDQIPFFDQFDTNQGNAFTNGARTPGLWTKTIASGSIDWTWVNTPASQISDNDPTNIIPDTQQANLRFSNATGTSYQSVKTIIDESFETAGLPAGWTENTTYGNSTVEWRTSSNTAQTGGRSAYFGTSAGTSYQLGPDAPETLDIYANWDVDEMDLGILEPGGDGTGAVASNPAYVYFGRLTRYGKMDLDGSASTNLAIPSPPGAGAWGSVYDEHYKVSAAGRADGLPGSTSGAYEIWLDGIVGSPFAGGNVTYVIVEDAGTTRGQVQTWNTQYVAPSTKLKVGDFNLQPSQRVGGELTSPTVNMTGLYDGVMEFYDNFSVETQDTANYDQKKVYIYDGTTWTDITNSLSPPVNNTNSSQGWTKHTYNIPAAYSNNPNVKFKFEFDSIDGRYNSNRGWNIDGFKVTANERVAASVVSPTIDLTDYVSAKLTYKDLFVNESDVNKDIKSVYYSPDNGTTWHLLRDENSYLNSHLNYAPYDGTRDWTMNDEININPGPVYTNHTPSTHIDIPTNPNASSYKIKIKFTFDSIDGSNNNFDGWSLDDVKITGSKYEGVRDTWAGGSLPNTDGNGPGIWSNDINVTARTIANTTTVDRYVVRKDPDNKYRIYDRFGDGDHADTGETPNYKHTGGSTQKSNFDNTVGTSDDYNFFDYVPKYNDNNSQVAVFTIDTDKGFAITTGQDLITNNTPGNPFDENGIQSIDNFEIMPRYYVNGSGNVVDRFGDGTKANNANIYMTSNDDGNLSDEFASGGDDENLIDYDPNIELVVENNYSNVPIWTNPMLVQAGNVASRDPLTEQESRIVVAGTNENIGTGDGNQYAGSEEWNEYIAQFRFGISNPSVNTGTGITAYLRYVDNDSWVRLRYDHDTNPANSRLYLEYQNNGAVTQVASIPYNMTDPVGTGANVKFIAQGERFEVYVDDILRFNERIPNAPLYGKFGFGADRTMWCSELNLTQIPLLQVQFLGDGLIRPTSAQDIIDQLYLAIFPAEKGLKYSRQYGGTYFQQTEGSLKPWPGKPGLNAGLLEAYSLEQSNVDTAKQMTHLASSRNVFDILMKQWTIFDQQFQIGLNLIR